MNEQELRQTCADLYGAFTSMSKAAMWKDDQQEAAKVYKMALTNVQAGLASLVTEALVDLKRLAIAAEVLAAKALNDQAKVSKASPFDSRHGEGDGYG